MGIDPALAGSLDRDEAATKLAAIPDSEALQRADDAIARGGEGARTTRSEFVSKMEHLAQRLRDGSQRDFANASLAELLAFCVANGGISLI
jgi:hypothetical protein